MSDKCFITKLTDVKNHRGRFYLPMILDKARELRDDPDLVAIYDMKSALVYLRNGFKKEFKENPPKDMKAYANLVRVFFKLDGKTLKICACCKNLFKGSREVSFCKNCADLSLKRVIINE